MQKILKSTSESMSIIQFSAYLVSIAGLFHYDFNYHAFGTILLFYFLYCGIGVSMMYHRYWTHRTFKIDKRVAWILTLFGIVTGRGSPLGWAYIHRVHHKHADSKKDPHSPSDYSWRLFFPHLMKYDHSFNQYIVRDMMSESHLFVNKFYNLLVFIWLAVFFIIDPWLVVFAWAIPVAITNFLFSAFLYLGHSTGYRNFNTADDSTNLIPFGYLLWGEGWHNNHHANPGKYNVSTKWWELDLIGLLIKGIKQ